MGTSTFELGGVIPSFCRWTCTRTAQALCLKIAVCPQRHELAARVRSQRVRQGCTQVGSLRVRCFTAFKNLPKDTVGQIFRSAQSHRGTQASEEIFKRASLARWELNTHENLTSVVGMEKVQTYVNKSHFQAGKDFWKPGLGREGTPRKLESN